MLDLFELLPVFVGEVGAGVAGDELQRRQLVSDDFEPQLRVALVFQVDHDEADVVFVALTVRVLLVLREYLFC